MEQFITEYLKIGISLLAVIITFVTGFKSYIDLKKTKNEVERNNRNFVQASGSDSINIRDNHSGRFIDGKSKKKKNIIRGDIAGRDIVIGTKKLIEKEVITDDKISFELKQLENYYSQVLNQSKYSFWFSLVFASIGFVIIIISGFLYNENNVGSTVISMTSGVIIDSVSALFFVQTKRAQKNMTAFFQKLREDKQYVESKKLCESINSEKAKDALKIQLALNFAGIENPKEVGKEIISQVFE